MNTKTILVLIAIITVVSGAIGLFQYVTNLKAERDTLRQNYAALTDTLRITKTEFGEIGQRYAMMKDLSEELKNNLALSNHKLLSQIQVVAQLETQLASAAEMISVAGDSIIAHRFEPQTYSDSGLTFTLTDSVFFRKTFGQWFGTNFATIDAKMRLVNRITRDESGLLSGSVESLSPMLHIESIETVIDDKYSAKGFESDWHAITMAGISSISNINVRGHGSIWYKNFGAGVEVQKGFPPYWLVGYSFGL